MVRSVARLQCDRVARASGEQLVRSTRVLDLEPLYAVVTTHGDEEDRLAGVKMLVVPPAGETVDQFTRSLQCHEARTLLRDAHLTPAAPDPYWLPESWVDIDVESERGAVAVVLRSGDARDDATVLDRARSYARMHGALAVAPDP